MNPGSREVSVVPPYVDHTVAILQVAPVLLSEFPPYVIPLKDMTGYSGERGPTYIAEEPTSDCHILLLSQWLDEGGASTTMRVSALNPVTRELTPWTKPLSPGYEFSASGAPAEWRWGPRWHFCMDQYCYKPHGGAWPWGKPPVPEWLVWSGNETRGYFYATFDVPYVLRHTLRGDRPLFDTTVDQTFGNKRQFTMMKSFSCIP